MTHTPLDRAPQEKVCGYEYTVKRGDSFYLIAHRLGVPLRDLLEANSDINPARLMVGDVLCIPMEEDDRPPQTPPADDSLDRPAAPNPDENVDAESAVCPEADRRRIAAGETVSDVQLERGLNRHTLQSANPHTDLDALRAGQVLCVPAENLPCPRATTYTLRTDETLESAALALNTSVGALLRANPCLAPADFTAGVCITVPE